MKKEKVVIIGGGFAGITVAKNLDPKKFDVTLVDKTNHHLFQPLLYQVATAALSPGDIASPLRSVLSKKNVSVLLGEVNKIDTQNKTVEFEDKVLLFDKLIIAIGTRHSYFGKPEWEQHAPGLKTLEDALKIRENILFSLEEAEKINDKNKQSKFLTFVVIGAGPTGVEMAGAIAEIAKKTIIRDFKNINPADTKVYLIEAQQRVLTPYTPRLSENAKQALEAMGVKVLLNTRVVDINDNGVLTDNNLIEAKNIIWAAGNTTSTLLEQLNTDLDKNGRPIVNADLSIKNNQNIYVIGDASAYSDNKGNFLPQVAQVAIQQAVFLSQNLNNGVKNNTFIYNDKGSMATIGKAKAVAMIKGFEFSGFFAWLLWSLVHAFFLITYRNRIRVLSEWIYYYFTSRQGVRLITRSSINRKT